MLDHVDAKSDNTIDASVERGMGGDGQFVAMALVDDGLELFIGKLERVVTCR